MRALYVITRAQRRGAEIDATLLAEAMAGEFEPLVVTLYPGDDPAVLGARVPIRAATRAPGILRRLSGVSPASVRHVRDAIASFRPDLVVAYGGEATIHAVRAAGRDGPPVLAVRITLLPERALRGRRGRLVRRSLASVAAIGAVDPSLADEARERLGVQGTVFDTPQFRPESDRPKPGDRESFRAEVGAAEDTVVAAFVASLVPEKGPDLALEAISRTPPNVTMVLAGEGPLEAALRERATSLGLGPRVRFLGARTDVPRVLAGSDLLVLPGLQEGRPGILLEAALAGLPAVCFDVGGVSALVRDGVEGLLVPAGDVAGLAGAITRLADDGRLRERMSRAAEERSDDYLAPGVLPRWRVAYGAALARRPA